MTDFNPNYNNAELLDQELTAAELSQVSGGLACCYGPSVDPGFNGLHGVIGEFMLKAAKDLLFPSAL